MITKNFSQLCQHDLGVVIRCVAVGRAKQNPFIIAGCIDSNLYIFDKDCHLLQKVTFGNWVRCCAMADIDGDGDAEIIAGAGDKSVKILKLTGDTFQEIRSLEFPHIVNACAIADVTGNGVPEILIGTWGCIVYALDVHEYNILWQKEFLGWINFIYPGDVTGSGQSDLLVGTRDGVFYVVEGKDGHIIWDYKFAKEINAASIADVDNSGVSSILVGGNSDILTIFTMQGNILREIPIQSRIISIATGDIDGDHANEIILGCGDNTLRVLENRTRDVNGISLKWRGNFGNTIRGIQINDIRGNGINEIIFGGYNKVIQAVQDFHWGKKPIIEVYPVPVAITPTQISPAEKMPEFFIPEKINRIEDLLANSPQELVKSHETPVMPVIISKQAGDRIEQKISLQDSLENIIRGKDTRAIEKARQIPRTPSLLLPKIMPVVPQPVPEQVLPSQQPTETPISVGPLAQYCDQVVEHLKTVGVISSKAKLVDSIKSIGVPDDAVEGIITKLTEDQRLAYSRTAPRGYGLVGVTPVVPVVAKKAAKKAVKRVKAAKRAKVVAISPAIAPEAPPVQPSGLQVTTESILQYCDKVVEHLKTVGIISSKAKLVDSIKSIGVPDDAVEGVITKLTEDQRMTYSRTAPRGYGLVGVTPVIPVVAKKAAKKAAKRVKAAKRAKTPPTTPVTRLETPTSPISDQEQTPQTGIAPQNAPEQEKSATKEYIQDVNVAITQAYTLIKGKGLVSSKPELIKLLEEGGISPNLADSIINELKNSGRIVYSRVTPRGYSAV